MPRLSWSSTTRSRAKDLGRVLVKMELNGSHAPEPGRRGNYAVAGDVSSDDALLIAALVNRSTAGAVTDEERVKLRELLHVAPSS